MVLFKKEKKHVFEFDDEGAKEKVNIENIILVSISVAVSIVLIFHAALAYIHM